MELYVVEQKMFFSSGRWGAVECGVPNELLLIIFKYTTGAIRDIMLMNTLEMPKNLQNPQIEHVKHWHYVYRRRRQRALGINAQQMAWSQVFSLIGSVIAGVLLESNKTTLALLVGAFVVLPGIFDLNGTLGAALSAKINHRLEDPKNTPAVVFIRTVSFALFVSIFAGLLVAGVGASIAVWFFNAQFWQVFWLAETAVILSAIIGLPLIGGLSLFFRSLKMNPDDVVGPIESSVFDILTVISMAMVIGYLV